MSGKHQSEFKVEPKVENTDDSQQPRHKAARNFTLTSVKGDDELTNHSHRKRALL